MSSRADRGDPHEWNSLENYLQIHDTRLQQYIDEGFVLRHELEQLLVGQPPRSLMIRGRIYCARSLFLDIQKELIVADRNGRLMVRTEQYRYHTGILGDKDRTIFRYDNAHAHVGHQDEHHKHVYDPNTWEEILPRIWVGRESWPHLSNVLEELQDWWNDTGRYLGIEEESHESSRTESDPATDTPC